MSVERLGGSQLSEAAVGTGFVERLLPTAELALLKSVWMLPRPKFPPGSVLFRVPSSN